VGVCHGSLMIDCRSSDWVSYPVPFGPIPAF